MISSSLLVHNLRAEENGQSKGTNHIGGWFSMGIGSCYFEPTGYIGFSFAYNENIFTVRSLNADEFRFNPGGGSL
jgi:hypothetical protein